MKTTANLALVSDVLTNCWMDSGNDGEEYLPELCEVHYHHKSSGEPQLTERDIVVMHSNDQVQTFWKLRKIEKALEGADG